MFHISSSCDHQQDPWSYNFMRVMSRAFRLHQNIEPIIVVDLRSLHLLPSSFRLVNNSSSRKRLTTLSYHKLYIQCFTSRHHVISNKIHDLTTLCASCRECFDCIKTFTHHVVDLTIPATQHFITSSRITSMSSRKRHATLYVVTKLYTRIDRWSFRFLLSRLNRNFVSWTMCSSCHLDR